MLVPQQIPEKGHRCEKAAPNHMRSRQCCLSGVQLFRPYVVFRMTWRGCNRTSPSFQPHLSISGRCGEIQSAKTDPKLQVRSVS
jgi:hypothetical protein